MSHDGLDLHSLDDSFLFDCARVRARVREVAVRNGMNFESIIGLAAAALLLIYLTYALLRPEKF